MTLLAPNTNSKSSYLILHAGALGDCVLMLHVAMALRKVGHHISVAARSPIAAWAAKQGSIDQAIPLDRLSPLLWGANSDSNVRSTDLMSVIKNFDSIISFLGGPNEDLAKTLTGLAGHNRIIHIDPRPNEQTLREGRHITKQWVDEMKSRDPGFDLKFEISNLIFQIPSLHRSPLPGMFTSPNSEIGASQPRHSTTSPHILVHPGSGGRAKCCPLEHLEALMAELHSRGVTAQWMIGPDEVERDGDEFRKRLEGTAPVVFKESVEAAADLVAAADVFIGNDSGMTHVAALAGIPTSALFGPTDPRVWRPLGPHCAVIPFPSDHEPKTDWVAAIVRGLPMGS